MEQLIALLVNGGLVAAVLEAVKRASGTSINWTRFGALIALAVGVVTAVAAVQLGWYGPIEVTMGQAVFSGLMAGITASGLNRGVSQNAPEVRIEGVSALSSNLKSGTPIQVTPVTAVMPEANVTTPDAGENSLMGPRT